MTNGREARAQICFVLSEVTLPWTQLFKVFNYEILTAQTYVRN